MKCDEYRRFQNGRIETADFEAHCSTCRVCRESAGMDLRLLEMVRQPQPPLSAPGLWERIESSLREEQAAERSGRRSRRGQPRLTPLWPAAAALAALAAILILLVPRAVFHKSGLLEDRALARVEKAERSYSEAISKLEALARPRLAARDLELMFLYNDRLEIIDEQIEQCRAELAGNPGNAHIRRYLLAALQDKKQTLEALLLPGSGPDDINSPGGIHENFQ